MAGHTRPKRSLGQNFLVDPNIRRRIVEEVRAGPHHRVLEIGPGKGALTEGLAARPGPLILVELDRELAASLRERFAGADDVTVVEGDILDLPLAGLVDDPGSLHVVGNIPYNVTTPILFHLLKPPRPLEIVLMVQREVADRILAEVSTRQYGALSVGVRAVAEVERLLQVPSGAFRPRPRVESTVIRIRPIDPSPLEPHEEESLRRLTRALFQWRRKQLGKILRDHPELQLEPAEVKALLDAAKVEVRDRPETISPRGFRAMARILR